MRDGDKRKKFISLYGGDRYEDNTSNSLDDIVTYAKEECLKHGTTEHIYQLIKIVSHVRVEANVEDVV